MDQINTRDLRSSIKGKGQKRQVILSGRKGKVYSDFIERQTDTKVKIVASQEEPLIVSLADGFNDLGQVDHTKSFTQDITDIEVAPNSTNFILMEKDDAGLYTTQVTKVEPIYGTLISSDRENKVCASFNAPSGSKTFNDPYGNFFRFYGGSEITSSYQIHGGNTAYFNGAVGSYAICELANLNTSDLDQWTLEFDVKFNTLGVFQVVMDTPTGVQTRPIHVVFHNDNRMRLHMGDGAGTWIISDLLVSSDGFGFGFNTTQVYNIVILFNKNNVKVYVDGVLSAISNIFVNNWNYRTPYFQNFVLGHMSNYTTLPFNGYIANFQFWPYAKYSNYSTSYLRTPGANVFSLSYTQCVPDTPQPQRYVKNNTIAYFDFELPEGSTNITDYFGNKMITSWSGSDSVHQPRISSSYPAKFGTRCLVKLGTANFANRAEFKIDMGDMTSWTIEFWHYYDDPAAAYTILYTDADYSISIGKSATPANNLQVLIGNGSSWITTMTSANFLLIPGNWHHIALTFDGQVYRMFLNGSLQGSYSSSVPFLVYKPGYLTLGHLNSNLNCPVDCAYDDFAVFNYCKYTANFTPPTEPLSNTLEPMYYYDIKKAKMYKGFYNQLVEQSAIFLGEVKTFGSKIEEVISYAINGQTGPIPAQGPSNDTTTNSTVYKHNIGSIFCKTRVDYVFNRNYIGYVPFERISGIFLHSTDDYDVNPITIINRNIFSHLWGGQYITINKLSGAGLGLNANSNNATDSVGSAEIFVERAW